MGLAILRNLKMKELFFTIKAIFMEINLTQDKETRDIIQILFIRVFLFCFIFN